MRLDPLGIVLKQSFKPDKKFYFISGNEKTFIEKIKSKIIERYKEDENTTILSVESINDYVDEVGLFGDKKLILIRGYKEINDESLNRVRNSSNTFIFTQENSQKIKKIKNIFLQDKDAYLIDCYELDKNSKIKILNEFIRSSGVSISEDILWYLIEKLDSVLIIFLINSRVFFCIKFKSSSFRSLISKKGKSNIISLKYCLFLTNL